MGKDQELIEAARSGNLPALEKILTQRAKKIGPLSSLRRGKDANVQDNSGYSPLHHAALNNQKDAVQCLLEHEASTNIVDLQGSSPLHLAAWTGNVEIVRLLLCHGPSVPNVNLKNKNNETSLHCAAQYGHTAVVSLLLKHSCDPSVRNNREETALDLAAQYGRLETVELLLRHHTDLIQPYSKDYGRILIFPHTPLHLASRNGHKAVVKELLNAGVDVNVRTSQGSALNEAALCGKVEVVRTLLENGIDVNIRDHNQQTVLDILREVKTSVTQEIQNIILSHHPSASHSDKQNANRTSGVVDPSDRPPGDFRYTTPPGGYLKGPNTAGDATSITLEYSESVAGPAHHDSYRAPEELYNRSPRESSTSHPGGLGLETDRMSMSSSTSTFPPSSPRDQYLTTPDSKVPADGHFMTLPREKERDGQENCVSPSTHEIYIPMCGTQKDSRAPPLPPRKPPRRSLSVSPTHHPGLEEMREQASKYEFLYLARSGKACLEESSPPPHSSTCPRCKASKSGLCKCHRISHDQYVDMKLKAGFYENLTYGGPPYRPLIGEHSGLKIPSENGYRKSHSYEESDYENYDVILGMRGKDVKGKMSHRRGKSASEVQHMSLECELPPSPTHYEQPPTPDHPPPSPIHAERSIYERIMPLAQDPKRKSKDMETETEEVSEAPDTCSFSSCLSLSDKSISTDNFEDICSDFSALGLSQIKLSNSFEFKKSAVGQWLSGIGYGEYEDNFLSNGYDDMTFMGLLLNEDDLDLVGVTDPSISKAILESARSLSTDSAPEFGTKNLSTSMEEWLQSLNLECYIETFRKHLYTDMEKISGIIDDELVNVLEITKPGHRKRILHSLNKTFRSCNGQQSQIMGSEGSSTTLRSRHKKARPPPPPGQKKKEEPQPSLSLRLPSELMTGLPSVMSTNWRHLPEVLVQKAVHYVTMYLGAISVVDGEKTTSKCVQELKQSFPQETEVMMSISHRAVLLLNTKSKELICEHDIVDIQCACQDADDLSYFAYIVKDAKNFKCHVFHSESMERATEITLTLGEAFEVAYQLTIIEQQQQSHQNGGHSQAGRSSGAISGHSRSQSANQPMGVEKKTSRPSQHTRSQSANEMNNNNHHGSSSKGYKVGSKLGEEPDGEGTLRAPLAQDEEETGEV